MLMLAIGEEFAQRFAGQGVTKVFTLEASGDCRRHHDRTGPACAGGYLPKKDAPSTLTGNAYFGRIHSFTKNEDVDIMVSANYLSAGDRVLVIDDFLASGEASRGMIEIIAQAGAALVGVGIVIEKAFQDGGSSLRDEGVRVESLARIASLANGEIHFA